MESISGVGVIDKVVGVLRALEVQGSLNLLELQTHTCLPRATAHRLASALQDHGLIQRDSDGRYWLGWTLIELGRVASKSSPLIEISRPVLEKLRISTGEGVQLYVREGEKRRCVMSLESPHGLRWIVPEGALLSLDAGSAGHVLHGHSTAKHGWLASVGEREAGVASVSAPVVDIDGKIIAAISVSGPIERLTKRPGERHGAAVVLAARSLSKLIKQK